MAEAPDTTGREPPMIRLCLNCDTENPVDAVICSECGMSLTRARTGETAEKVREEMGRTRLVPRAAEPKPRQPIRTIARILALAWAGWWTFLVMAGVLLAITSLMGLSGEPPHYTPNLVVTVAFVWWVGAGLLAWAACGPVLTAWRWQRVGAILLLVEGSLLSIPVVLLLVSAVWQATRYGVSNEGWLWAIVPALMLLPAAALPLAAGILFLASWWKSRTSESPQATR